MRATKLGCSSVKTAFRRAAASASERAFMAARGLISGVPADTADVRSLLVIKVPRVMKNPARCFQSTCCLVSASPLRFTPDERRALSDHQRIAAVTVEAD